MTSETSQTSTAPAMTYVHGQFTAAAGPLAGGLAGMFVGVVLVVIGTSVNASSYDGSGGGAWIVFGLLVGAVGAVFALVGVHVLVGHVDDWARDRHQRARAGA